MSDEVQASTLFMSLMMAAGVTADELAAVSGLDADVVRAPTLVPYSVGRRAWEAAERITGDPHVGLTAGARCDIDQIPGLGSLFAHSTDLQDAIERVARVLPQAIRGAPCRFDRTASGGRFVYVSPSTSRHGVDAMFAVLVRLARRCTDHHVVPASVAFQSPASIEPERYARFFGALPRWDASESVLSFVASDLSRRFRGSAPALADIVEANIPALVGSAAGPTSRLRARLERAVLAILAREGQPTLDTVAAAIGWTRRTLQRRLEEDGVTFRAVRDAILRERADALLLQTEDDLDTTAGRLGFSSRSSFERAYRRWTGRSPTETRRAARTR